MLLNSHNHHFREEERRFLTGAGQGRTTGPPIFLGQNLPLLEASCSGCQAGFSDEHKERLRESNALCRIIFGTHLPRSGVLQLCLCATGIFFKWHTMHLTTEKCYLALGPLHTLLENPLGHCFRNSHFYSRPLRMPSFPAVLQSTLTQ